MTRLRIGTRGSPLALWQAEHVAQVIAQHDGPKTELVTIRTSGDQPSEIRISEAGGKRVFVKEIEDAVIEGRVDLAVHSAKDLPAERLPGLTISAALPREDPRDAVVSQRIDLDKKNSTLHEILSPDSYCPRVGTGSIRRAAQLRHAFPDLDVRPIRGNVGTRLRKLDEGAFDLLILATAGLVRLHLAERILLRIPVNLCVPAPGQGIVVGEFRTEDLATSQLLCRIADRNTNAALQAERALVTALGADCQLPIGAIATPSGDDLYLCGIVATPDGTRLIRHEARGPLSNAAELGTTVANGLLADGAQTVLDFVTQSNQ